MLWKVAPQCLSKTWTRSEEVLNFLPEIHDSVSMDTSVALIIAKTASPFLRFIRLTWRVVMIEVTGPAAVLMTICETTLSDKICSILPGKRFRMLVLIMGDVICASRNAWVIGSNENKLSHRWRERAFSIPFYFLLPL